MLAVVPFDQQSRYKDDECIVNLSCTRFQINSIRKLRCNYSRYTVLNQAKAYSNCDQLAPNPLVMFNAVAQAALETVE